MVAVLLVFRNQGNEHVVVRSVVQSDAGLVAAGTSAAVETVRFKATQLFGMEELVVQGARSHTATNGTGGNAKEAFISTSSAELRQLVSSWLEDVSSGKGVDTVSFTLATPAEITIYRRTNGVDEYSAVKKRVHSIRLCR